MHKWEHHQNQRSELSGSVGGDGVARAQQRQDETTRPAPLTGDGGGGDATCVQTPQLPPLQVLEAPSARTPRTCEASQRPQGLQAGCRQPGGHGQARVALERALDTQMAPP
ncbi:hypothetical protein ABPG75_003493 [Micractinium tetrahymenae]